MSALAQPGAPPQPSVFGPKGRGWPESDPFWYPINPPSMTSLQTNVQAQLQLNPDSDFWWDSVAATCSVSGGFSVYLTDASRGIPLLGSQIAPLLSANIGGMNFAGVQPQTVAWARMWLPRPYRLPRNTILSALFNNLVASANQAQIVLGGRNVS